MTIVLPFRFYLTTGDVDEPVPLSEFARRAEGLGYDGLLFTDHLLGQLGPIAAMTAAAAATEHLKVGTFVINNDLRHPVVLAQELASIDRLSGGRLIIGLGAGWNEPEYRALGVPFEAAGRRIGRLEESVQVLKALFADGRTAHFGEHYQVDGFEEFPRSIQRPHPPFLIGGGSRRTLSLAAREAQIVGLAPLARQGRADFHSITAAGTDEKLNWIRAAAGARFDQLDINTYSSLQDGMTVTDNARPVLRAIADRIRDRSGIELSETDIDESPHVFVGSVDHLVEKFLKLRERWAINSFTLGWRLDDFTSVVERLAGR